MVIHMNNETSTPARTDCWQPRFFTDAEMDAQIARAPLTLRVQLKIIRQISTAEERADVARRAADIRRESGGRMSAFEALRALGHEYQRTSTV